MLQDIQLKPITGTFISPLLGDTGINNWGLREWEQDFRLMKVVGIDTVIVIRCEMERGGHYWSALDPRSTTWPEDPNILSMFFRLADEYGMNLFLGGPVGITNLHVGDWRKELEDTKRFYEKMFTLFGHHKCFTGLYNALEALPWHFNFFDILLGVAKFFREIGPDKKTLISPSFYGPHGDMTTHYTPEQWIDIYGRYFFEPAAGLIDYCAPQDKFAVPDCRLGEIHESDICEWYRETLKLFERCGIELWANIETFQRPYVVPENAGFFRQSDYRTLYMKLQAAAPYAAKLITFEFDSCMSPKAEWGSSRRLLERYLEMIGRDPTVVGEIVDC